MTATVPRTVDWDRLRREYDGGRGEQLNTLAAREGISPGTLYPRAAREGWSNDGRPREIPPAILDRMRALIAEYPDPRAERIQQALRREFGDDPGVPTASVIRQHMPKVAPIPQNRGAELEPIHGLKRRCVDGCGQITFADPCQHCGTAAS